MRSGLYSVGLVVSFLAGCGSDSSSQAISYTPSAGSAAPFVGRGGSETTESVLGGGRGGSNDGSAHGSGGASVCGDGVVQGEETCDDGNQVEGDGCTLCRKPTELAWSAKLPCSGRVIVGKDETIVVGCSYAQDALLLRYSLDGKLIETVPNLIEDPNEEDQQVDAFTETADGSLYFAAGVRRNIVGGPGEQSRTRVYRFNPSRQLVWQRETTEFPGGREEYPYAIAVNALGQVAVAGLSHADPTDNLAFAVLLDASGNLVWKYVTTTNAQADRVWLDDKGNIYMAGRANYYLSAWKYAAAWGLSATGGLLWEWIYKVSGAADAGAVASDLAVTADNKMQVVGRMFMEDELVRNPPRTTTRVFLHEAQASTGADATETDMFTESVDGTSWTDLKDDAYVPMLASNAAYFASAMSAKGVVGLTKNGDQVWKIVRDTRMAMSWGNFGYKHLWCVEVEATLNCYVVA